MRRIDHAAHRRPLRNNHLTVLSHHRLRQLAIKPIPRAARLHADVLVDPNRQRRPRRHIHIGRTNHRIASRHRRGRRLPPCIRLPSRNRGLPRRNSRLSRSHRRLPRSRPSRRHHRRRHRLRRLSRSRWLYRCRRRVSSLVDRHHLLRLPGRRRLFLRRLNRRILLRLATRRHHQRQRHNCRKPACISKIHRAQLHFFVPVYCTRSSYTQ